MGLKILNIYRSKNTNKINKIYNKHQFVFAILKERMFDYGIEPIYIRFYVWQQYAIFRHNYNVLECVRIVYGDYLLTLKVRKAAAIICFESYRQPQ